MAFLCEKRGAPCRGGQKQERYGGVYMYEVVIWSTAHDGVIAALAGEHDGLPVRLIHQADNPADSAALALVSNLPRFVVGGIPYEGEMVIGYIKRSEPSRAELLEQVRSSPDGGLAGDLTWSRPEGWRLQVYQPDPNYDPDIPF